MRQTRGLPAFDNNAAAWRHPDLEDGDRPARHQPNGRGDGQDGLRQGDLDRSGTPSRRSTGIPPEPGGQPRYVGSRPAARASDRVGAAASFPESSGVPSGQSMPSAGSSG